VNDVAVAYAVENAQIQNKSAAAIRRMNSFLMTQKIFEEGEK
jgi:hypothetical protein